MNVFMKKMAAVGLLTLLGASITGCSNDYVIQKKNGDMIITQGKPEIDEDTGLVAYKDIGGNEHAINRNEIVQMIEK